MIPDRWLRIEVRLPDGLDPALAADLLVLRGAGSVVEDGGTLVTYFDEVPDPQRFVDGLVPDLVGPSGGHASVGWSWQPHEAWSELWKQGLSSRRIGKRLLVAPTWVEVEDEPGREVLRIDPGVAFGTAEHATTRGCLLHLDDLVRGGEAVLDLGSGSGILAIAAVRLGAREALAVEMDGMACATAVENAELNGVGTKVRVLERELTADAPFELGSFDIVVANMVVGLLAPRLAAMAGALERAGTLVVGGVQEHERDPFLSFTEAVGLRLESENSEDGWWSARLRFVEGRA